VTAGSRLVLGAGTSGPGIVHLGAGAFARAHTWWATAMAVDEEPGPWGVTAVAQRTSVVVDALRARDWRYDVRLVGRHEDSIATVAVVTDGLVAAHEPDRLLGTLASPGTRIITVTATEAGYPTSPGGDLDTEDELVAADLAGGPPRSVVGQIVSAADLRGQRGVPPPTVLVCDNIERGGRRLHHLATRLAELRGLDGAVDELERWRFPTSVVDRVVPAVEDGRQPDVVADPVFRWVVEDDFAGPRPAWERAGVRLVPDAEPWQLAKLLLVNAPHSLIAYLGLALGHDAVGPAVRDPVVAAAVGAMLADELVPCVPGVPGLDAAADASGTVDRFRDQVVPHALTQVGVLGSTKLPQRLRLPFERQRADAGVDVTWSTLVVALWAHALDRGLVDDPRSAEVRSTADLAAVERARRVLDVLGLGPVGPEGPDAAHDPVTEQVADWFGSLGDATTEVVRDVVADRAP